MQSTKQWSSLSRSISIYVNKAVCVRNVSTNNAEVTEDQTLKPWTEIPGPSSLPIIGQLHHFIPFFKSELSDQRYVQQRLFKGYGPIVRLNPLFGRQAHIFLFDPDDIAKVLRGENWLPIRPGFGSLDYYRAERNKAIGKPNKPLGLLTDQGENWKSVRSTVNPVMMQPKAMKLYAPVIEKVAQDMILRMQTNRDKNNKLKGQFDLEMNLWSLESIAVVALGCRLNCLTRTLEENSPERELIQCVHDLFHVTNELDAKPSLWRFVATKKFKDAMKLYKHQEDLAKYFIERSLKENESKTKNDEEKSILEKLYEIDEEVAITMACDMLFAGVDTVATAMTGIFYLLAKYPKKQEKLREELKKGDTKYLKACIKEGMRIVPVTSANIRQLSKDMNVQGYKIPKGTNVVLNHQTLQHSESQYPNPKEFIPERWMEKDSPMSSSAHPFSYAPFGFGVRMCVGRRIAELEMEIFLSQVIETFHIDWETRPIPELNVYPASLNYIKGPFDFVFKDLQKTG